jgi:hypothetical protein
MMPLVMCALVFNLVNNLSAGVSAKENLPAPWDRSLLVRAFLLWSFILVVILRLRQYYSDLDCKCQWHYATLGDFILSYVCTQDL